MKSTSIYYRLVFLPSGNTAFQFLAKQGEKRVFSYVVASNRGVGEWRLLIRTSKKKELEEIEKNSGWPDLHSVIESIKKEDGHGK